MMSGTTLFLGILTGSIGTGYFIYGKKQQKIVPALCGVTLCILPYVLDSTTVILVLTALICILPFAVKAD